MRTYTGIPTVTDSQATSTNGISQVVLNMARHLPAFGWQYSQAGGELRVHHAGEGGGETDIAICHGLHPTGVPQYKSHPNDWRINKRVIDDLKAAKAVVVPSEWVAQILRREFHIDPHIIHWGINLEDWKHEEAHAGYVYWNKNRSDPVCNPHWMNEVARITPDIGYISTFGAAAPNVKVIGRQPKQANNEYIKHAAVYLATTKETGDIGSREALASGVPVVAFAQGGVLDFVQQGVNGVLVPPGDVPALAEGIRYALAHRKTLSDNARLLAGSYGWESAMQEMARVFDNVAAEKEYDTKHIYEVSAVISHYNYTDYLVGCVASVQASKMDRIEIVIVDDCSTHPDTSEVLDLLEKQSNVTVIRQPYNQGVAVARNTGIEASRGRFVIPIDADDRISPELIPALVAAFKADENRRPEDKDNPQLGVAYSALQIMGREHANDWPPATFDLEGQLQHNNQIPTCAMFRREDFYRVGGYRSYMQPAEDADFFTRLLIYTGKTARRVTDKALFHYRLHEDSLSRTLKRDPYRERPTITAYHTRTLPMGTPKDFAHASNPVRHYDAPLVAVVITDSDHAHTQQVYATLDSLENQTLSQWEAWVEVEPAFGGAPFVKAGGKAEAERSAPFLLNIKSGTILQSDALQRLFTEGRLEVSCCGGSVRMIDVEGLTMDDMVLIEYISDKQGKHGVTGSATRHSYHMRRPGDRFYVYKVDQAASPDRFRIISEEPLAVVTPAVEPPPAAPVPLVVDEPIVAPQDAPPFAQDNYSVPMTVYEPFEHATEILNAARLRGVPIDTALHFTGTNLGEPINPETLKAAIEAQRDEMGRSLDETSLDVLKPDAGFVKTPAPPKPAKRTAKRGKRTG